MYMFLGEKAMQVVNGSSGEKAVKARCGGVDFNSPGRVRRACASASVQSMQIAKAMQVCCVDALRPLSYL